jgi:hypothetical protein
VIAFPTISRDGVSLNDMINWLRERTGDYENIVIVPMSLLAKVYWFDQDHESVHLTSITTPNKIEYRDDVLSEVQKHISHLKREHILDNIIYSEAGSWRIYTYQRFIDSIMSSSTNWATVGIIEIEDHDLALAFKLVMSEHIPSWDTFLKD